MTRPSARPAAVLATALAALALAAAGLAGAGPRPARAQAPAPAAAGTGASLEAVVVAILEEGQRPGLDEPQVYQRLSLRIESGARRGETVTLESADVLSAGLPRYRVGDRLLLSEEPGADGAPVLYISDRVRRGPLAALFLLFVLLTLAVARWRGLASLLAMAFTFLVLFAFLLPRLAAGTDPILTAIAAALIIIPVTYYLSHGINRKTSAAVIGTLIALALTGVLAVLVVDAAVITGYASEEASSLQRLMPGLLNVRGLLLASIIIGLSGILDDITISQAAIVAQLRSAAADLSRREVYGRAMDIGRDHIAALVNTLILVYASTALPLLLLFLYSGAPLGEVANYEIVAEEIVRSLVASIGLILAVPITTLVAAYLLDARDGEAPEGEAPGLGSAHGHPH